MQQTLNPPELARATQRWLLVIALIQGVLLWLVVLAIHRRWGAFADTSWSTAAIAALIAVPAMLLLVLTDIRRHSAWLVALVYGLVVIGLAAYTGAQCPPVPGMSCAGSVYFPFVVTQALAWSIALSFVQVWLAGTSPRFPYAPMFDYSWQNCLTVVLTGVLVGLFWGVLLLWGALFKVIGIRIFHWIFKQNWFIYPATALVTGVGVVTFRAQPQAVAVIRRVLRGLMRMLLPLLAAVAVLFLIVLPFTGLHALWSTGRATALMLWLLALILFFVNAVYQDGAGEPPYPKPLHLLVQAALALAPIYVVLSAYALRLRVVQHGWTVQRLWSVIALVVLAGFAIAYAVAVIRRRGAFPAWIRPVNKTMAVAVVVVCVLVASPVLDLRKLALADQLARLESGVVKPAKFDYRYLRYSLAGPGYFALQKLSRSKYTAADPHLKTRIENLLTEATRHAVVDAKDIKAPNQILHYLARSPANARVPAALLTLLYNERCTISDCFTASPVCTLVAADLNHDGQNEYLLVHQGPYHPLPGFFYKEHGAWRRGNTSWADPFKATDGFSDAIIAGHYEIVTPRFGDVVVGKSRLRVGP